MFNLNFIYLHATLMVYFKEIFLLRTIKYYFNACVCVSESMLYLDGKRHLTKWIRSLYQWPWWMQTCLCGQSTIEVLYWNLCWLSFSHLYACPYRSNDRNDKWQAMVQARSGATAKGKRRCLQEWWQSSLQEDQTSMRCRQLFVFQDQVQMET